jgi:S-adenosylmethionine/arginine decarboxylase-like enzyme
MEKFIPNHLHLLVKGTCKNPPKDVEANNAFLNRLVEVVGMKIIAGPTSVYIDELDNRGVTGTVAISTSHSSIHVWENLEPAFFQFDLYSCLEYSEIEVIKFLNDSFELIDYSYWFIDRNNDFKLISSK